MSHAAGQCLAQSFLPNRVQVGLQAQRRGALDPQQQYLVVVIALHVDVAGGGE